MDKEKILSQNKKENLYLDEYEKHIKLQGKSFGLMFVLFICILILFIKAVCKEPYYDIMTIIGSVAFGSMGYEAHISKNKSWKMGQTVLKPQKSGNLHEVSFIRAHLVQQ